MARLLRIDYAGALYHVTAGMHERIFMAMTMTDSGFYRC